MTSRGTRADLDWLIADPRRYPFSHPKVENACELILTMRHPRLEHDGRNTGVRCACMAERRPVRPYLWDTLGWARDLAEVRQIWQEHVTSKG